MKRKQKNKPAGFKLVKPFLLVFLAAANSGGLAQVFSIPTSILAAPRLTGSGTHPPPGCGCQGGAFCYLHLLGACGLSPPPWGVQFPGCWGFGLTTPPHFPGMTRLAARWRGYWTCAAGELPKVPPNVFSFWEKPPAQSCRSIQGRACPLTSPPLQSDQRLSGIRASNWTTKKIFLIEKK